MPDPGPTPSTTSDFGVGSQQLSHEGHSSSVTDALTGA